MEQIKNENQYVFAAFLNTAFDNFNDALKYICAKHDVEAKSSDDEKDKSVEKKRLNGIVNALERGNVTSERIADSLRMSFKFWDYLLDVEPGIDPFKTDAKRVSLLFDTLKEWRNYYTHVHHDQPKLSKEIYDLMDKAFDKAIKKIKKRFDIDEDSVYANLYNVKKVGEDSSYSPAQHYAFISENTLLTDPGLAFLICLFLHKRDAYHLLKQLTGFHRDDEKEYQMTLEAFTVMRFHNVKQASRLQQRDGDEMSIGMDMLNELVKCPKELYRHLNEDDKKEFDVDYENEDVVIGGRIRHKDRYESTMLKTLENSEECKDLGFYMGVGKYYMKSYKKTYIDETDDTRMLTHGLYVIGQMKNSYDEHGDMCLSAFGKELESRSNSAVHHLNDNSDNGAHHTPYISEAYPYYIINNGNIGLKWLSSETETIYPKFINGKAHNPLPDYWMSKYELPAMAFYAYLKEAYKDELKDCHSIKDIITKEYPHDAKPAKATKQKVMEDRLSMYVEEIDKKLRLLENKKMKEGEMADKLARDILWLQPSRNGGKDKLTGANFQALQSALARYSFMRDKLTRIFATAEAGLTTGVNQHPFLKEIDPKNHSTLSSFYNAYLVKEKKYIEKQQKEVVAQGKVNINFHPLRKLTETYEHSGETQPKPMHLHRGMFTDSIKEALCKINKGMEYEINRLGRINSAKLIQIYLCKQMKDDYPSIYGKARSYKCLDKWKDGKSEPAYIDTEERGKRLEEKLKRVKEKLKNEGSDDEINKLNSQLNNISKVYDNEKMIRLRQTQDVTTFLWVTRFLKDIMVDENNKGETIKLKGINNETLAKEIAVEKNIKANKGKITIKDKVKLKDYGRVVALCNEALPSSLFMFIDEIYSQQKKGRNDRTPLTYAYIDREMSVFNDCRVDVIEMVQGIERHVIDEMKLDVYKDENGYYNFSEILKKLRKNPSDIDATSLRLIRNGFCHGRYIESYSERYKDEKGSEKERQVIAPYCENIAQQFTPKSSKVKDDETLAYKLYETFKAEYEKVKNM